MTSIDNNIDLNKPEKSPKNYECKICLFTTANKKDYGRHLVTVKHKRLNGLLNDNEFPKNSPKKFTCKQCNNEYSHSPSLSRHKLICNEKNNKEHNELNEKLELIKMFESIKKHASDPMNENNENKYKIETINYIKIYNGDKIAYIIE